MNIDKDEKYKITDYLTFDDMELKDELLRGIYSYGFEKPSTIQQKAIVPLVQKNDLIAQAQSGTGKTATFLIGALQLLSGKKATEIIILSPTRELSGQTLKVGKNISNYMNINIQECIGGTNVNDNIFRLRNNPEIIVGTPGRILDMIYRKYISVKSLSLLIIDEADEMLSKGFKDQIHDIFKEIGENVQVGIFSATMSPEILSLTDLFMKNPINILVNKGQTSISGETILADSNSTK